MLGWSFFVGSALTTINAPAVVIGYWTDVLDDPVLGHMTSVAAAAATKPQPRLLGVGAGLLIISAASSLLMLVGPLFMMQIYDRVLASKSVPTLVALTGLVIALYAFYGFLEAIRARMATRAGAMATHRVARRLFAATVLHDGGRSSGPLMRDLDSLRQFLCGPGALALLDLYWTPIYLALVFLFHPMLGWLAVAGGGLVAVLMVINEFVSQHPAKTVSIAANRRQAQLTDVSAGAEAMASMGMVSAMSDRWEAASAELLSAQRKAGDRSTYFSSITKAFRLLLQSGVLAMGAYLTINGEITSGLMIAASIITARALAPVEQAVGSWRGFIAARQAYSRIRQALIDAPTLQRMPLRMPSKQLSAEGLAVGPASAPQPIVRDITFSLKAGEAMGVLGVSGCGKSMLGRTLVNVLQPLAGTVRLDRSELQHFDPDRIGRAIGYLPQMIDLFDGTIAQNISRFSTEPDTDAVLAAAAMAGVEDLVTRLPQGYDTIVGPRGTMLSAGQRQRIGLARALYGNPFVLVLDEPNSNLDSVGDAALNAAVLSAKQRGAIVIVIAHRPSAIAAVDKLLFLQNGVQAAFGPKDEVLRLVAPAAPPLSVVRGGER